MLTNETKRHIDAARQVLVGVVPNPASQVDQITNALIYKFMDDMDQAAIKQGDEPSFFVGDLEKYAWTRLMDSRIGNQERMNLYSEALIKFSESKQLPELFRNIFRSAFLPYRSPEVLGLFLNEINHFDYSHPEELGNAYEYLLQVMGSQGDAGQFRTPRHIIDFIVKVVSPTKDEKVLDPACGTAGFLISAYKHILAQHDGKNEDGTQNKERSLTPDDRRNITNNFEGYDIDPSMVRIAQVNMYLHQFKSPKIFQYDTLSMEERWGDKFDVILANPPFMSPKGGIRPHSKFSIQSNRSEVLFVDYIKEHLRPSGRAGIIVPEGVIFQSGTAYKELRRQLVEDNFLWAVISLPAGVFQPYSGVKTSILFFDRELAKHSDSIVFMKISNDGYDLGAQRRKIDKDDLPTALMLLDSYKRNITAHNLPKTDAIESLTEYTISVCVPKSKIRELGDYYLTGDRYKEINELKEQKWPLIELNQICEIKKGSAITKKDVTLGNIPVIAGGQQPAYYHNQSNRVGETITISASGAYAGFVNYFNYPIFASDCTTVQPKDNSKLLAKYVFRILKGKQDDIYRLQTGGGQPHIYPKDIARIKIPLPPVEVQKQIVEELDRYQKITDSAKQIIENWKPKIDIDPEWKKVKLGAVLNFIGSGATPLGGKEVYLSEGVLFIRSQNILWGECDFSDAAYISEETYNQMFRSKVKKNDVLLNITGASIGRCATYLEDRKANVNQHVTILRCKDNLLPMFLMNLILDGTTQDHIWSIQSGASRQALNYQQIRQFEIPLPSIEIQKQIFEKIEAERSLVESAKKLINIYESKTKDTIAKLWEE